MHIEFIEQEGWQIGAYYIENEGKAVLIDPMGRLEPYLKHATQRTAQLLYLLQTSNGLCTPVEKLLEDEISEKMSSLDEKTNQIQTLALGSLVLQSLPAPGYRNDSVCWLLKSEDGRALALFSGQILLGKELSHPDMENMHGSLEDCTRQIFHSLKTLVLTLPDSVIVYPGMAAGNSPAPEAISLGDLKTTHPALLWLKEGEHYFREKLTAAWVKTTELEAAATKERKIQKIMPSEPGTVALSLYEFKQLRSRENGVILDSRPGEIFSAGFVPGSLNIGLDGRFIEWAGSLLNGNQEILLVTEAGMEEETCNRLNKAGIFKIHGYLQGGFSHWQKAGETVDILIDVEADELAMDLPHDPKLLVVDVRTEAEFTSGHVVDAVNLPLADMTDPGEIAMLPEDGNWYLHCGGHYRSIIAASLLKRQGLHNLRYIKGGWESIREQKEIKTQVEKSALN